MFGRNKKKKEESKFEPMIMKCPYCKAEIKETNPDSNVYEDSIIRMNICSTSIGYAYAYGCPHCKTILNIIGEI